MAETPLDESQNDPLDNWPAWTVDCRPNPEQACGAMEAKQTIEKHVDQLSAGVRSAFRLRVMDGLSTKEVRDVLGISENVVKSRLLRARGQLTKSLRQSFRMPPQKVADILSTSTMAVLCEASQTDAS
jgi:RNA polymerase sigma factor (sigma-70 family)